jgi:alginate O-acetyltransferase complex protein AlgI
VALPIGISFITFEEISYLVDVYRGHARPAQRLSRYVLFLTLFPHAIAGPIFRWKDLEAQLAAREESWAKVRHGFERFAVGLAKKVLLADSVARLADGVFALPAAEVTPGLAWLGALAYTLQIYFDFSGYSDMAIGLGKMIGFDFKENFDRPYIAASLTEFWQRWHISLSSWMRDYLYIPLGGNRRGPWRALLNLVIVFTLSGLWHGAAWNYVVWGLFHGTFVAVERLAGARRDRLPRWLQHALTLLLVVVGWVFFRAAGIGQALDMIGAMFGAGGHAALHVFRGQLLPHFAIGALIAGALIALAPLLPRYRAPVGAGALIGLARQVGCVLLFVVAAMHLTNYQSPPLIYFKF